MSAHSEGSRAWRQSLVAGLRVALARFRFVLLLGAVLLLVAAWPTLRNVWDTLTGPPALEAGVSSDTEYWCPMCPGVASDWPGKCPVCHMALVPRQKGEMTPLPDGALARMQFPPYRVQLAGIHTSRVEFRPLVREVLLAGLLGPAPGKAGERTRLTLATEVFENDVGLLAHNQSVDVTSEAFPGRAFPARVAWLAPQVSADSRGLCVRLEIDDARQELRPGMFVTARVRVPLACLAGSRQLVREAWRLRTALGLWAGSLACPLGTGPAGGLDALLESAVEHAALHQDMVLAIPDGAVIDTGTRTVVFLERGSGLFDAVEVRLGRRCGDFFPVLGGLAPGEAVVTAGAFLLDAETRLNPAAAASYFGAGGRGGSPSATPSAPAAPPGPSPEDERLAQRQKVCPVTGQPLGSMGAPFRAVVDGRAVFLCCEHCAAALRENPRKYLRHLPR
jgi:YHS domain-containing protein